MQYLCINTAAHGSGGYAIPLRPTQRHMAHQHHTTHQPPLGPPTPIPLKDWTKFSSGSSADPDFQWRLQHQ